MIGTGRTAGKPPPIPWPVCVVTKYWVPVSRIDNAYGDRHIICACPPIEAYLDGMDAGEQEA